MEAVPRLPMLHFPRKESTEKSSFNGLKQVSTYCTKNRDSIVINAIRAHIIKLPSVSHLYINLLLSLFFTHSVHC